MGNPITIKIQGALVTALEVTAAEAEPAAAVREVCSKLIQQGRNPELPVRILEAGRYIAKLPSLRAVADMPDEALSRALS